MGNEVASRRRRAGCVHRGARAAAIGLLCAGAVACSKSASLPVEREPPAEQAGAASTTGIPTLTLEKFAPEGTKPEAVYAVEGGLVVVEHDRVGRIEGGRVAWLDKTVPKARVGPSAIVSVNGRWPDRIGVVYTDYLAREPQPIYVSLTGPGLPRLSYSDGEIRGVAQVGDATIVSEYSPRTGVVLATVRGTADRKPQTAEQAGCSDGEVRRSSVQDPRPAAIRPGVLAASRAGTLVSIGQLCEKRGAAAEIWDRSGASHIVDLSRFWKEPSYVPELLQGEGDELWAISDAWGRVLHYRDGAFEAVPDLGRPIRNLFVSPRGELHASDGRTLYRHERGRWIPFAQLAVAERFANVVMDDAGTLWVSREGVYRLRPAPGVKAKEEGCATPFVYLHSIGYRGDLKTTHPAARRALSTFPEAGTLGLVEFGPTYDVRLGVTVTSMAQGEAVIAHLRETMKDEDPRLFCYAPEHVRKIDLNAKE